MLRGRTISVMLGAMVVLGLLAPVAGAATTGGGSDQQIAQAGVLVASDLPAAYTASVRDASSDTKTQKVAAKLPSCKKFVVFRKAVDKYPEAKSEDYTSGATTIYNSVSVFPTDAAAKAAVDAYAAANMPACFSQLVGKLAQQAGGKAKAGIKRVKDVTAGDQAVAYEGPVQITESDGSSATLAFGNLVIRIGRGVAVYSYNHDASSTISSELTNAVNTSGARLQTALAG